MCFLISYFSDHLGSIKNETCVRKNKMKTEIAIFQESWENCQNRIKKQNGCPYGINSTLSILSPFYPLFLKLNKINSFMNQKNY